MRLRRLLPIRNALRNRISGQPPPELAAAQTEVVQPSETERRERPAFFLPGQLELATAGVPGHSTLEDEFACLQPEIVHAPVIRYTFRNCFVHAGGFDTAGYSYRIKTGLGPRTLFEKSRSLNKALYCMSQAADEYFGHWLQDACATAFLQSPDESLILDQRPDWPHAREYVAALGLKPEPSPAAFVETLTAYQDYGQGSLKRMRYAKMRERLANAYAASTAGPAAVYFRRGATGAARLVANEDAVMEELSRRGFEIVELAGTPSATLYNKFKDARIVVGIDGSHLNHLYFSLPVGASLVTLLPADRFTLCHVGYTAAAQVRYGFLVVTPTPSGYVANIPDLLKTIDLVTAA